MNDIYLQKARKYKYKYLKLKQDLEGAGWKFSFPRIFGKSKAEKAAEKATTAEAEAIAAERQRCDKIRRDENINGTIFDNGKKRSYNALAEVRQKLLEDRDYYGPHRDPYKLDDFINDGCPTSDELINKVKRQNDEYKKNKPLRETAAKEAELQAKASEEAYKKRKAAEEEAFKANEKAMTSQEIKASSTYFGSKWE